MRRSDSIILVLLGSSLGALGYHVHRHPAEDTADDYADVDEGDFGDPATTQPSSGNSYSGSHFYYHNSTGWTFSDDMEHHSSGTRSFSSSHTSRGGFGSHGHGGHS